MQNDIIVSASVVIVTFFVFHVSKPVQEVLDFICIESDPFVQRSHPLLLAAAMRELNVADLLDSLRTAGEKQRNLFLIL